jgi:hypothetical protein
MLDLIEEALNEVALAVKRIRGSVSTTARTTPTTPPRKTQGIQNQYSIRAGTECEGGAGQLLQQNRPLAGVS